VELPVSRGLQRDLKPATRSDNHTEATPSSTFTATATLPPGITLPPTHAPFPTANIAPLPTEFSDIPPSVVSCWDAHANYSTTSSFLSTQLELGIAYSQSEYPPGHVSLSTYLDWTCSNTALPSLTTLCDGYPRASTTTDNCVTSVATYTWSFEATMLAFTPTWSTELEELPSPTCTIASDFGPICSRLRDAYNWRVTHLQSQVPSPTGSIAGPECSVINPPVSSGTPLCYLEGGSWEASYWPTPLPTGSALCGTNETNMTTTRATPGQPVTAVISGLTLTSPSVYHFVRNATLQTFAGRASLIGEAASLGEDAFAPSTTASLLTVAQREEDILTLSRGCAGSGRGRYCYFRASAGFFSIADLVTVRATEYCRPYDCYDGETILQDEYTPTAALAMTDIVAQNGVFTDCAWTTPGARVRTAGPAAWRGPVMKTEDWHKITATGNDVKETTAPRTTS
jgi:hypothetical protein